jgi:lipid II:glycine glycyltransferase (peptidoglycan interpeptide bridge formation enzyme)
VSEVVVRPISADQHLAFLRAQPSASFLQTPAWGRVKTDWRHESLGWYDAAGRLAGVGLVLYRRLPRSHRAFAYLPEGPVLDWSSGLLPDALRALVDYLKGRGAFGIRVGPPVELRRWHAATVKAAIASRARSRLGDVPPDQRCEVGERVAATLRGQGWRPAGSGHGFSAGQPRFVFQLPLAGRSEADLLAGMNQQWRRNIKKAAGAGVKVELGGLADLAHFHGLYVETAERDGFRPRPLAYFSGMFDALLAEDPDRIRLYLAHHDGELVAATTWVRVGSHAWYSYGASSAANREVRGSNAIQWQMIRDARAAGCQVYDLRGITDTLEESDREIGLTQFKVGTGGDAVERLGEWDLPLARLLYRAFDLYLRHR